MIVEFQLDLSAAEFGMIDDLIENLRFICHKVISDQERGDTLLHCFITRSSLDKVWDLLSGIPHSFTYLGEVRLPEKVTFTMTGNCAFATLPRLMLDLGIKENDWISKDAFQATMTTDQLIQLMGVIVLNGFKATLQVDDI